MTGKGLIIAHRPENKPPNSVLDVAQTGEGAYFLKMQFTSNISLPRC